MCLLNETFTILHHSEKDDVSVFALRENPCAMIGQTRWVCEDYWFPIDTSVTFLFRRSTNKTVFSLSSVQNRRNHWDTYKVRYINLLNEI